MLLLCPRTYPAVLVLILPDKVMAQLVSENVTVKPERHHTVVTPRHYNHLLLELKIRVELDERPHELRRHRAKPPNRRKRVENDGPLVFPVTRKRLADLIALACSQLNPRKPIKILDWQLG